MYVCVYVCVCLCVCVCVCEYNLFFSVCFQRAVPSGRVLLCQQWRDKVHEVKRRRHHPHRTNTVSVFKFSADSLPPSPPSVPAPLSDAQLLSHFVFLCSVVSLLSYCVEAYSQSVSWTDIHTYRSSGNTWFPAADGLCPVLQ